MTKLLTVFLATVGSVLYILAGQTGEKLSLKKSNTAFCSSTFLHEERMGSDKAYREKTNQIENDIYQNQINNKANNNPEKSLSQYILPVVFHIIHNNGPENISDALVLQGLQDLNDAFENVGYYDQGTGVDADIEFCLATRDPDGMATTGITRDTSVLTDLNYQVQDLMMKNINRWDPTRYVNVWVVNEICGNNGCGVAGYAYLPGAHGSGVDGIVMEANFLGSSQSNSSVLVHEAGHYLGLRHTFQGGCLNDDCLQDGDKVCDTPPDNSTAAVPCAASANSCFTDVNLADSNNPFVTDQDDMFINYMDYGNFTCYSAFTAGQRDRMQFFTTGTRASLLDSDGCMPPCLDPLTAAFTASTDNIIAGQTVNFTNTTVNGTTWEWQVDGTSFSSMMNSSFMFNAAGTFTITLNAFNADPNCSSSADTTITVICDTNAAFSASETTVQTGSTVTFTDASVNVSNYNWTIDNVNFSSIASPDYTFNTPGNFTICLEGDNGICSDQSCQTIFVNSVFPDNCNNTFFKLVGDPFQLEQGLSIIPSDDGNFFLTGMRSDSALIMKMTPSGDFIWQRSFKFTNRPDEILDLRISSDGNLLGAGQGTQGSVNNNPFYFKYDPVTDNFLWATTIAYFNGYYSRIHEADSASNYLIIGAINDPRDGLITSISPSTGSEQWTRRYNLNGSDDYESAVIYNNKFYATGRHSFAGNFAGMRGAVTRFNFDGTYDHNRLYIENQNQNVRMYSTDIIVQNDSLVVSFFVDKNGTGPDFTPTMAKTDLDGNILWAKDYEINEYPNVRTKNIIELPDGLLLHGNTLSPEGRVFMIKTDHNGNTEWAKAFGGIDGTTDINILNINRVPRSQVVYFNNFIYFTAGAWNFGDLNEDLQIFVGKIRPDGTVDEENCPLIEDITINETTYINPYDGFSQFTESVVVPMEFSVNPISGNPDMEEDIFCQELCTEIDIDILGDAIVCLSEDSLVYKLDNLSDCEPTALSWEVSGGTLISSGADSVIVELPATGQIEIIAFTELNCFSISDTLQVIVNDSLNLDLGEDLHVCDNATFTLNAGSGFSRYEWFDGSTDSTFAVWLTGDYWVDAEDACGNILRDSIHVTIDSTVLVIDNQFSEICPGQSVTINLSGYDDYQWFPSTGLQCDNCPTNTVSPTLSTGYWVVASTDEGCISVDTIGITIPEYFTGETQTICAGETAIIFGNPQTQPNEYSDFYTTAAGCDSTHTVTLVVLDTFYTTETLTFCSNDAPFPDGTVIENMFQAENGCDSAHAVIYQHLPSPSVQVASTGESCDGNDGSVSLTFQGGVMPFSYLWDANAGNQTTASVTGLSAGNYQVTITGGNQCETVINTLVMNACNCNITLNLSGTPELNCFGDQNGFIAALGAGGTGNYTYNWSANAGGQTTPTITGLSAGTYSLTLNDGPACLTTAEFLITEPDPMFPDVIGNDSECGEMHASAFAFVAGGEAPYSYVWSNGETSPNIQNLSSGNYSFTVTDTNGCMEAASAFIVSEGQAPILMADFVNSSCAGANDGSIDITVEGGEGPFTYMWSDGIEEEDRAGLSPGVYTVWVTDANGCLAITTVIISESGNLTLDFNSTASSGNDGTASVTVFGGATPFTYQWNNGGTTPFIDNLAPGNYTVSVTDANGCTGTGDVEVNLFTGTFDIASLEIFDVNPNPTTGQFEVYVAFKQHQDFTLEVYNIPGQLLYRTDHQGNHFREQIQLDRVAAGLYFVALRTEEGLAVKPLIVLNRD